MHFIIKILLLIPLLTKSSVALEIIRDIELENYTYDLMKSLSNQERLDVDDLNIYFINSNQVNAFVTGGKNIFINTELIIEAEDYREYAAVLAHELAHIEGGHIFSTSIELANLSGKAFPIYLLGIIGIMTGTSDTGIAGVMIGQASVSDGFRYYSRTQEASADQLAVNILCTNGISANFLVSFLDKLELIEGVSNSDTQNYKSTHPLIKNRITWINSSLSNYKNCEFQKDELLSERFELLKAKLHGYTHPYHETEAVYNSNTDADLYATAVSSYSQGDHNKSIEKLEILIKNNPLNPFYKELLGEIYFSNNNFKKAAKYQKEAINKIKKDNDLYYMMLGNYLLSHDEIDQTVEGIKFLKKSLHLNPKNAYSWYLLARAYAETEQLSLANYATAERYFLIGERALSYDFAIKAVKNIEEYTPEWYRSSDLIDILENDLSKR